MMFDIYGIIDLSGKHRFKKFKNPFRQYKYYKDVVYTEYCMNTPSAEIHFLERNKTSAGYFQLKHDHIFVYGSVFSNKELASLNKAKTRKLSAKDVYILFKRFGRKVVHYIKGSFVLILYNEKNNKLLLVSDHLNVLPVFYAWKDGLFVFSSAIKPILDSGIVSADIDITALLEFTIFDYALGDRTFYKKIRMLDYGRILEANSAGIKQERYFYVTNLFQNKLYGKHDSLQMLSDMLYENANLLVSDVDIFLFALTGGFDCRMNLSLIDRPSTDYVCYSYGMPGSHQLNIPKEIAKQLHISYISILLDGHFEELYEDCALRALFYSDGNAPILRANYPYAYERLKEFSSIALTGLFGSEILRPIRNLGLQINSNSIRLFTSRNFDASLEDICGDVKGHGYLREEFFKDNYDELREHVWTNFFADGGGKDALARLYNFFIEEGVRKYFMQEIRIERVYIETRFPYFDFDFVKAIFSTPYAGLYNGAFKESPIGRRNAQSLYAYVIDKFKPDLGQIPVDRGYRPADLLSPLWFLKIFPGYLKAKMYYRKKGDDTFDAERWTDLIFSKETELMKKKTDIFPGILYDRYVNGENLRNNYRFSRIFSLKYWFEHDND